MSVWPDFPSKGVTRATLVGRWRDVCGTLLCVTMTLVLVPAPLPRSAAPAAQLRGLAQATPSGTWSRTGSMITARDAHSMTLLRNGTVLVAGGADSAGSIFSSAELYDPGTGTWTSTGSMANARSYHTATLLPDGRVLVAGGVGPCPGNPGFYCPLSSAELYDPGTGTWTATGSMIEAHESHTATLLPNGQVLVAGGIFSDQFTSSAELYDPRSGTWAATGTMSPDGRANATATLLHTGRVLVAGGELLCCPNLASAQVYEPRSRTWSTTGTMSVPRLEHTATLLPNGTVLVAGGNTCDGCSPTAGAEVYDPPAGTWTATASMATARAEYSATLLPDGRVLVAGGFNQISTYLAGAELYDPRTRTWSATGSMSVPRGFHTATLLRNGTVLVAGGCCDSRGNVLASAEIYRPATAPGMLPRQGMGVAPHHSATDRTLAVQGPSGSPVVSLGATSWPAGTAAATTWRQQAALSASDGAPGNQFGTSIAIVGTTIAVGAPGYNSSMGAVYVFVRSGSSWTQQAELRPADGLGNDFFGYSVALSGNTLLVGAYGYLLTSGAAYIFVRNGSIWTQQTEIKAPQSFQQPEAFGDSVALSGDTALIGADGKHRSAGAAYVYVRHGSTWSRQQEITATDGMPNDLFGASVALSGNTALIGARYKNGYVGAAYVYVRNGSTWSQQAELTPADSAANAHFGYSVALSGTTGLVGAPYRNNLTGATYAFVRSGATWAQQQVITAASGAANDQLGYALALSGDTSLLGAPYSGVDASGGVYVFVRHDNTWSQQATLTDPTHVSSDAFGSAVALGDATTAVGAPGASPGVVYVFVRTDGRGAVPALPQEQTLLTHGGGDVGTALPHDVHLLPTSGCTFDERLSLVNDNGTAYIPMYACDTQSGTTLKGTIDEGSVVGGQPCAGTSGGTLTGTALTFTITFTVGPCSGMIGQLTGTLHGTKGYGTWTSPLLGTGTWLCTDPRSAPTH